MKNVISTIILVFFCALLVPTAMGMGKYELVQFPTEDGGQIQASLFKASNKKVVIFAHGAIFDKESWYFLAEKFQDQGVSALSIDFRGYGKSKSGSTTQKKYDILGAVSYLTNEGYTDINIIGGSMGGAAVLSALSLVKNPIQKVVLLAPAGGPPIKSAKTGKLFVVSKGEGLYDRVRSLYNDSSEPKTIKEYDGSAHAQHMFKEDYADELVSMILDFIGKA